MSEDGRDRAERLINHGLFRCIRKVVGAADDVGDVHVDVVHHDAQLIGGKSIRAQQDEILNFGILQLSWAEDGVFKPRSARGGDAKPDRWLDPFLLALGALGIA